METSNSVAAVPSNSQQLTTTNPVQNTLEQSLANLQDKWTDIIKELNELMKNLKSLDGLMNEVYYKRQEALDLYYGTNKVLLNSTREYKLKAASIYNLLKNGSTGIRYTNESALNVQIEAALINEKECIDLLNNFILFMKDTVLTIDNIIYGINSKIKVYEMMNGLKF